MPATPSQIASLIRQREKIGKHLGEIAQLLGTTESELKEKIKSGSSSSLSQENAQKVLDYLRTV